MNNYAIIIPARYDSSRFKGKPLALILNKPMIQWVYEKCVQVLPASQVFVATDSEVIREKCVSLGMNVIMTSAQCLTGTDRIHEALKQLDNIDIVINVQGDEPLISPDDIKAVIKQSQKKPEKIYCAYCEITEENEFRSCSIPKVVFSIDKKLLYMSRAAIPTDKGHSFQKAYKQVCVYVFPRKSLEAFYNFGSKTPIEKIEDIEILRFLELGFEVGMVPVSSSSIAVDFPEDINKVEKALK